MGDAVTANSTTDQTEISAPDVMERIVQGADMSIIDVRIDEDLQSNPVLIPGSIGWPFLGMSGLAAARPMQDCVVVCHKGLKLSQGAAAELRALGVSARALRGGILGWLDQGLPIVPRVDDGPTRWVLDAEGSPDAIAASWLLHRFAAPRSLQLWVPERELANVADRFDAGIARFDRTDFTGRLPIWPELDRVVETIRRGGPVFAGARRKYLNPNTRAEALWPVCDMILAAGAMDHAA